ncbi:P-loop NTPase fold protein [Bradyrhizobium guangdongense]
MTATEVVKQEIERFLRSPDPEVLCITGEWGVGKTFTWHKLLDKLRSRKEVGLMRYSYVSLFGINSLEAFKLSIFENLEFLVPQGNSGFEWMVSRGNSLLRESKRFVSVAGALPKIGDALSRTQPFLFSTIRSQIVCVDDLERRGEISVKDILGLLSYLREQRACKIVLLLNQSKLEEDEKSKQDFADYFEKVIDTKVVFAPSSQEAVEIAIEGNDQLSTLIADHAVKLRISNIRVLKKIERLVRMVAPMVEQLAPVVLKQTVHTMVMFGWSKYDKGASPPPIEYLRESRWSRYFNRKDRTAPLTPDEERWDLIVAEYDFGELDKYDLALLQFVETSILDSEQIRLRAKEVDDQAKLRSQAGSLEDAWRLFHESFADNEEEVCNNIFEGVKANFAVVGRANLDEAVTILRNLSRDELADGLIEFAKSNGSDDFWLPDDPFNRVARDPKIKAIADKKAEAAKAPLDFEADLVLAAQSFDHSKIAQLAQVPDEDYLALFRSRSGLQLRTLILSALDYRRISNADNDMKAIVAKAERALRIIAKGSRLNALRLQKYSVSFADDESENSAQ